MSRAGRWEEFPTLLGGRVAYSRYRLKRWRVGIHPRVKKFPDLGWVIALDVHLGRRGLGFWPIEKGSRPGMRWVPVTPLE